MKNLLLKSARRFSSGKQSNKILRKKGILPGVLYRPGIKSISLSVRVADIDNIIKIGSSGLFLLDLELDGEKRKVTIKELQRHPVTGYILHIDFYEVTMEQKIKVNVPIRTIGKSVGVESGGMLQIINRKLHISCLPKDIPAYIDINIEKLGIGDSIHLRDIFLSQNTESLGDANSTILTILNQKKSATNDVSEDAEKSGEEKDEQI